MAKEQSIGLVFKGDTIEWACLAGDALVGQGHCELRPLEGATDEEKAAALAERVQQIKAACGPLHGHCSMALASEHVLLRVASLPHVEDDELQGFVELQMDKISPFPVESMVASHEVFRRGEQAMLVLIGAARGDIINGLADQLKAAGIKLARVDAAVLGVWRLLSDGGHIPQTGRHVFLLLDGNVPELIVVEGGVPLVVRSLGEFTAGADDAYIAELAGEVSYTLMSLELEHGAGVPDSVVVWHRGDLPRGLEAKLAAECACEVRVQQFEELPTLAEGVARRLRDRAPGTLDFTPAVWISVAARRRFRKRALVASASVLLLWLVTAGGFFGWMALEKGRIASLTQERDQWRKPAMEVRAMRRRSTAVKRYMTTTHSALECLREICLIQPDGVDLISISYYKDDNVKISGEADNVNRVYELKAKLDASALFVKSTLQGPHYDNRKRKQIFDIEMTLPGGDS